MEKETDKILKEQYVPNAEFYSQIVDSLQDYAIFTVDKELNINSWNSAATKIFQFTTDEIIGKPFEIIFTKEDIESGIPKLEIDVALKEGRSNDVRWHLRKDESTFYADGLVFPLKNEEDEVIGYVKILRDITARKASEDAIKKYAKELEELNTHKENVLAILSHDLRSPLAGIIQGAEYLKLNYDTIEPDLVKVLLDEFHIAVIDELAMLDYLVEWARIKYAAQAFEPTNISLNEAVTKVFKTLKETAAINAINFRNDVDDDCVVFGDAKMVNSILHNLVSNAIKHSEVEGKIAVSANESEDMMIVKIKDSGIGMSKETQEELFSPQMKSLSKAVENDKGAGIGLLLVKGFLEKSGGTIWVESLEGKGSSFYFTLPINKLSLKKQVVDKVDEN
ncbi:MAG TPA: PAS domain-containing sensor histidine kinase [Flavobacterium sp.]|nr:MULTISPECIES: PAS domain-containing sensor histidine kinase [unclassified Flavobacterium]HRE78464.1 PAS domain-containing sensor histidine kinase [Flavobacterium sp.]